MLLLVVTTLQSLVTTGPVTLHPERGERGRCVSVSVSVVSADTALGETAELSVEEQSDVSVIHPR